MSNNAKHDFEVPDLPPVPSPVKDPPTAQNWLWRHHNDSVNNYISKPDEFEPYPVPPLTDPVTADNPLKVDLVDSIRSPYSYLVVDRLAYLQSNFNCTVDIHVIFPVAVNSPGTAGSVHPDHGDNKMGEPEGGFKEGGRWYKWADACVDCERQAHYNGIPFAWANPDPVTQNHYPFLDTNKDYGKVPQLDDQPWISWMVRLANAADYHGKSLEFLLYTGPLIWGGQSDFWPADIPEAIKKTGLDYDELISEIKANPAKFDGQWQKAQKMAQESGHGGVPNMIFNGEPHFGQDRFGQLFTRLVQSGLTRRDTPIHPIVPKPRRFPDYDKEVQYAKEDLAKRSQ